MHFSKPLDSPRQISDFDQFSKLSQIEKFEGLEKKEGFYWW